MQQLSPMDSVMLYLESASTPNQVSPVIIYEPSTAPEGMVRFKAILETITKRLHLAPSFRRKLISVPFGIDNPYWVEDENFDIEYHVRHIALPKPGDWRQFCILLARLMAQRVDMSRPPWEMFIIEGLDNIEGLPAGSFAALFKIHHACMDGVAGAELMSVLHDLDPSARKSDAVPEWQPKPAPSQFELLSKGLFKLSTRPGHAISVAKRTLPLLKKKGAGRTHAPAFRVPHTRFNETPSPHRVFEARFFPLKDIKAIRALAPGATVNDVSLAIVAGALRRYLEVKGELPEASLVAGVPISTRSTDPTTVGNELTAQTTKLYTDIDDPAERLQSICSAMEEAKAYVNAVGAKELAAVSEVLPGNVLGYLARTTVGLFNRMGRDILCNTVVTNVPGSQLPLYFAGAQAIKMFGGGPLMLNLALMHVICSYCGEMVINVTACRKLLPDPAFYAECISDSFNQLLAATRKLSQAQPSVRQTESI